MKTRSWIIILSLFCLLSAILGFFLLKPGATALEAQIYSGGRLLRTVHLLEDQSFTVPSSDGGFNEITVKDGKIAVTSASCPDHYCMHRGFCNSGAPIICLPNQLEIRLITSAGPDISTN